MAAYIHAGRYPADDVSPSHAPIKAQETGSPEGETPYKDGITVVMGWFARLVRCGLIEALRDDPRIHLLADNLDRSSLEANVTRGGVQVAVLDETVVQQVPLSLRAIKPGIGLIALARQPTATYGRGLVAWGISCLDWDVSSDDVRAAVYLAVAGGCMFVSRDDRVECSDWQVDGLLTERERAVLERHIAGDSYEQIALALKISVRTAKAHTASARGKLRASSRRDLLGIPLLTRKSHLPKVGETPTY